MEPGREVEIVFTGLQARREAARRPPGRGRGADRYLASQGLPRPRRLGAARPTSCCGRSPRPRSRSAGRPEAHRRQAPRARPPRPERHRRRRPAPIPGLHPYQLAPTRVPAVKIVSVVGARPQFIKAAVVSRHPPPPPPGDTRSHRPALRPAALRRLLQRAGPAGARPPPRRRLRQLTAARRRGCWRGSRPSSSKSAPTACSSTATRTPRWRARLPPPSSACRSPTSRPACAATTATMPEELNRVLTDHCADLLFCPSAVAVDNLAREGITAGVHLVGDVMYDSLLLQIGDGRAGRQRRSRRWSVVAGEYALATVHRAANTDDPARLDSILRALGRLAAAGPLPVTPADAQGDGRRRSLAGAATCASWSRSATATCSLLERHARCILTDSGGVQKEAFFFGVPCVTLRDETEWPETVDCGWNALAGCDVDRILAAADATAAAGRAARPLRRRPRCGEDRQKSWTVMIHPTAEVSPEAKIGPGTRVWNGAQVREGAVVGAECNIGKDVYIDKDVVVGEQGEDPEPRLPLPRRQRRGRRLHRPARRLRQRPLSPRRSRPKAACCTRRRLASASRRWCATAHRSAPAPSIIPGVTIGRWAMVGAGSLVTRDVPDQALVKGSPARVDRLRLRVRPPSPSARRIRRRRRVALPRLRRRLSTCRRSGRMKVIPIARPLIGDEEKAAVLAVLDSGQLAQGPRVREPGGALRCHVRHAGGRRRLLRDGGADDRARSSTASAPATRSSPLPSPSPPPPTPSSSPAPAPSSSTCATTTSTSTRR